MCAFNLVRVAAAVFGKCPNYSAPLQALSRPPGVSPLEPPARASLQRCRSLTLPPNTLTALALLLPQSGIVAIFYLHDHVNYKLVYVYIYYY